MDFNEHHHLIKHTSNGNNVYKQCRCFVNEHAHDHNPTMNDICLSRKERRVKRKIRHYKHSNCLKNCTVNNLH